MNPLRWSAVAAGVVILLTMSRFAHAQVERRGGDANGVLLEQIQQLTSERASLQSQNADLKKQLDAMRKDRDKLESAGAQSAQRVRSDAAALAQSTAQRAEDEKDLKLYQERMQQLIAKFRETIETLRKTEIERAAFKQKLGTEGRELKVCMSHNAALYKLNEEVLNRWERQSFWSRLARSDPFTRIAQTRLENLGDDYASRADDQRLDEQRLEEDAARLPPPRAPAAAPVPGSPGQRAKQ